MKTAIIVSLLAGPLLACWGSAGAYLLGYFEDETAFRLSNPIIDLLGVLIFFLLLAAVLIQTLLQKSQRIQAALALLSFWPLTIGTFLLLPTGGVMIVHGLRDRVLHDYSLEDLRQFAHAAREAHLEGNASFTNWGIPSPPEQRSAYDNLRQHYKFLNWLPFDGKGTTMIVSSGADVSFGWGGALSGHWGCSIRPDAQPNNPAPQEVGCFLRASQDIYFYFD